MKWFQDVHRILTRPLVTPGVVLDETPAIDTRWNLLNQGQLTCRCCQKSISDLLSLAYSAPEDWPHPVKYLENGAILDISQDFLSQDLCRINQRHFIRSVMMIPLYGSDHIFILGLWVEVSKTDFEKFLDCMPTGNQGQMAMIYGTIGNIIPNYRSNIPCFIQPQDDFQRPIVHAALEIDPLFVAQIDGLDFDQLTAILNGYGHEINYAM